MERPAVQLQDLQELQRQLQRDGVIQESDTMPPGGGGGGERGLRDFNYNGRVRNSERSSGVLGRHQPPHESSYSIYSNYSSWSSSEDGNGDVSRPRSRSRSRDRGGQERMPPPPMPPPLPPPAKSLPPPLTEQPRRQPGMEAARSTPGTADTAATAVADAEDDRDVRDVRAPPPTYAPDHDMYNRVRFVDQELRRESSSRGRPAPQIEMAQIAGHNARAMWVFACCAFFWYRCLMDEDF
ncbi:hypothetical protein CCHL11_00459 [Colletotrichum chlorophyti]|uniref:Uncharacterized protein n=1 Tax=Colletotrichum chlorophyti TaxID=708187 RepID=A0A1Q8RUI1_9PEZI|nr:hypothetical protein CCHL11_00459 [Colletotrichum chlorophyti]